MAVGPSRAVEDLIAPESSEVPEDVTNLRLVIYNEYLSGHVFVSCSSIGSSLKKEAPLSALFSAQIRPPCSWMMV